MVHEKKCLQMKISMNSECPFCGIQVSDHQDNLTGSTETYGNTWGKICPKCKRCIKPPYYPKFIENNKLKLKLMQEKIRNSIRKRLDGDNYADPKQ